MDMYAATEQAFKNGYEKGVKEFAERILKELKSSAIVYICLINKKQTNHGFLIDDVFYCVDNTLKELTEGSK